MRTLSSVDHQQAMTRSLSERHTIWELVNHITFWIEAATKPLLGEEMVNPSEVNDWPSMGKSNEDWNESTLKMEKAVNTLLYTLDEFSQGQLLQTVPNTNYSYRIMIHGMLHHNLYHSGQIAVLKKNKS